MPKFRVLKAVPLLLIIPAVSAFANVDPDRLAADAGPYNSLRDGAVSATPERPGKAAGESLFEDDFESYTIGTLPPQGGWSSSWDPNANVVDGVDAIEGQSGQHTADGSGVSDTVDSPTFGPEFGAQCATLRKEGTDSLYQVFTIDSDTGVFNTRVNFEIDGRITVGQVNDAMTAFDFIDSGEIWFSGIDFSFGIAVTETGDLLVYKDGSEIFAGLETNFVLSGTAGRIGQWRIFAANDGTGTDQMIFDNLTSCAPISVCDCAIPTVGETGLLLLGALLLGSAMWTLRRRPIA